MRYPIVIHKDKGSSYGVIVPDLPGCFSAGDTLDETFAMAREAIECHIEGLLMDGVAIPELQPIQHHLSDPDLAEGVWALVDIDFSRLSGEPVSFTAEMPKPILAMTDEIAEREGDTRSALLTRAVIQYVQRKVHAELDEIDVQFPSTRAD